MIYDEDKERTLVAVLNEGSIPFKRIIPKSDKAFVLEHRVLNKPKSRIILFQVPRHEFIYHMFIYDEHDEIISEIQYQCMENTWSVYNSLCKFLNGENLIIAKQIKWRKEQNSI